MQGGAVVRLDKTRQLLLSLVALGAVAATCALVAAQVAGPTPTPPTRAGPRQPDPETLRLSRDVAGDSKPIILHADAITTWTENGRRVLYLQGQVLVEQGVVQARFQQGVIWIDLDRLKRTRILHADVYAEGGVHLQNGLDTQDGPRAVLDLNTRGEFKVQSHKSKVAQESRANDPLFLRAQAEALPAAPAIQRTSVKESPPSSLPPPPPAPAPGVPVTPLPGPGPQVMPVQNFRQPAPSPPAPATTLPPAGSGSAVPPTGVPGPPPSPGSAGPIGLPPLPVPGPPPGPTTTNPPAPGPPTASAAGQPETAPPPRLVPGPPPGPDKKTSPLVFSIAPRTAAMYQTQIVNRPNGEQALILTGGIIMQVRNVEKIGVLDMEADRAVVWYKGNTQQLFSNLNKPEGHSGRDLKVYLAGNVELREQDQPKATPLAPRLDQPGDKTRPAPSVIAPAQPKPPVVRTLRAEEVFYDVDRNVALALNADLEVNQPGMPEPLHFRGVEVQQLSPTQFHSIRAKLFSSKLASDPGLSLNLGEATLEEKHVPKRGLFGPIINPETGKPVEQEESLVTAVNAVLEIEGLPVFYFPWAKFDARDPLGPVRNFTIGYNTIFGFQTGVSLNVYDLIGIEARPNTRWTFDVDYLSLRGPALGTEFDSAAHEFFGMPARDTLLVKAFGINDAGEDNLGGGRGPDQHHPDFRGRFLYRQNVQELPEGFSIQAQGAGLSDKNFLEQYNKIEFDNDVNQETFLYVKQQQDNWAWTILGEQRVRDWVTETSWLPRADGYLLGESFFNLLTYNAHASAGYAQLQTTHLPPPPISVTDQNVSTGRFDLMQELSLPFYAGPVKVVPYGVLDLTYYTEDLTGSDRGRIYGGGGVRASIPFTRLYPDIQSEWFNLNAINHKIELTGNFYAAQSDTPFIRLPQLDRLNDDATNQAISDIKPREPQITPVGGLALATSPLFDPQLYAIRRLVMNRIDTLDDIETFQADVYQRWQTKRGYPGQQHIVDWMTLDLSATIFPDSQRDHVGEPVGFLEYDWLWNVGDRNGFVSSGWFDPAPGGASVWNFGAFFDRNDHTSLFLGYRQIDPVGSKLVIGSISAVLSPKYAITASTSYDLGTNQNVSTGLALTRIGSDLQVTLGFNYNVMQNSFGFVFEILPNVVASSRHNSGALALTPGATTPLSH